MKKSPLILSVLLIGGVLVNRAVQAQSNPDLRTRGLADTVGFARLDRQMDSIVARIGSLNRNDLIRSEQPPETVWKTAICPHDDYLYAGWLYRAVLSRVAAKTIVVFGVAHKARSFGLENRLVFDGFESWHGPYGPVRVSSLREEIIGRLPEAMFVVQDSMQSVEHSVEALIPFLQHQRHDVEIVSILVPYMTFDRMQSISRRLAGTLNEIMTENGLHWGADIALCISSDAVHYGDEDWGGSNYAPYGTDSTGNARAVSHEMEIIDGCFRGELTEEKISRFFSYTVDPANFRQYQWTWCGRYSIPFGLLTSLHLAELEKGAPLTGIPVAYATSLDHPPLKVEDLGMGRTAVATPRHWVGYPAVGFK
jgi:MEMO1 family protein